MVRRIASCAALVALMITMSACVCPAGHGGGAGGGTAGGGGGGGHEGGHPAAPCHRSHDCSACYRSEADRDMGRLADDWPDGGCCCSKMCPHGH